MCVQLFNAENRAGISRNQIIMIFWKMKSSSRILRFNKELGEYCVDVEARKKKRRISWLNLNAGKLFKLLVNTVV